MNFFENQWVEVFRAGEQTDSAGNTREWTDSDLRRITRKYNKKKHEAPLVIGHPKDNAPAFGWVEQLKTDGKTLFARFSGLVPEFVEAVRKGLYKKRSISLYPDLSLRHVGFLGATPPAIKGLADIRFSENESITFEFKQETEETPMAEKKHQRDPEVESLRAQLYAEQAKNRRIQFKEFIGGLHSEGKIISDYQETLLDLMEIMHEAGEYQFSEEKACALDIFKDYLESQPPMVEFNETVKKDVVSNSSASEQLNILAMELSKDKEISFSEALSIVQAENKDLAQKAAEEL